MTWQQKAALWKALLLTLLALLFAGAFMLMAILLPLWAGISLILGAGFIALYLACLDDEYGREETD